MHEITLYHGTDRYGGSAAELQRAGLCKAFCRVSHIERPGIYFSPSRLHAKQHAGDRLLALVRTNLNVFDGWDIDYFWSKEISTSLVQAWREELQTPVVKKTALSELKTELQRINFGRGFFEKNTLKKIDFTDVAVTDAAVIMKFKWGKKLFEHSFFFQNGDDGPLGELGLGPLRHILPRIKNELCQAVKTHYPERYQAVFADITGAALQQGEKDIAFKYTGELPLIPAAVLSLHRGTQADLNPAGQKRKYYASLMPAAP